MQMVVRMCVCVYVYTHTHLCVSVCVCINICIMYRIFGRCVCVFHDCVLAQYRSRDVLGAALTCNPWHRQMC